MAEAWLRQGALAGLALEARARAPVEAPGVVLCERAPRGQLVLRGDAARPAIADAVRAGLGLALPSAPNTVARGADASALWLGPDEWLLVVPAVRADAVAEALAAALSGEHHALVDVGHARTVIGLAGPHARDVLAQGCGLDLHPRVFGPDRCAQSLLARCHFLLHQLDDEPSYDLYVARSFARYAWAWLEDAARGHRPAIVSDAG